MEMEVEMEVSMPLKMEHSWCEGNKLVVLGMDELLIYLLINLLYYPFTHLSTVFMYWRHEL